MMGMDWILTMSKWMLEMEHRPACRIPVWLAQGALDQTVEGGVITLNIFAENLDYRPC